MTTYGSYLKRKQYFRNILKTEELITIGRADPSLVVYGAFPDLPNAFDRVRHKGLLNKLKRNGIRWFTSLPSRILFKDKPQRVVFNGKSSNWKNVVDVPQGSVLGPLIFLPNRKLPAKS